MTQPDVEVDVLVAGAGPTGLVLALWLAKAGVRVRVIDQLAEPGTTSRAIGVHARTLELYRQLGLADEVVAAGFRTPAIHLWVAGKHVARGELGDMGAGLSPFPYLLMYPQHEHERLLIAHLARAGVQVDRPRALVGFEQDAGGVRARLDDGTTCRAAYLAGCDGARSTVREQLGTGFPGGTYEHLFYVADVDASGPTMDGGLHLTFEAEDFLGVFPLAGPGRARLIGTVRGGAGAEPRWDDVSRGVLEHLQVDVARVNWFSSYHVHHRVANAFRVGRAFLLGDAAHVHSPVGAQGMNTGIGDACNLAWKLAAVVRGAPRELLDSYETERIAFARRLVATTDRMFQVASGRGRVTAFARAHVLPRVMRSVLARESGRRLAFRLMSQIQIEYRDSALSRGRAGDVHGGDRLPWVPPADAERDDNFTPLASRAWQVHVYGDPVPALRDACRAAGVALHVRPWSERAEHAGLARAAAYLVRPDGYVAWAGAPPDELHGYLARVTHGAARTADS